MAYLGTLGTAVPTRLYISPFNTALAAGLAVGGLSLFRPFSYVSIPNSQKKSIRGYTKDDAGAGISRLVMAIDRATGELRGTTVSSAVDGHFEVLVPSTAECIVVMVANNSDARNAVVLDRIVPVDQL